MHFIPFVTNHNKSNLNLIIGKNGTGKTSILEILDVYFNKKTFHLSHEEKRIDAYIAPIICVEKTFIENIKSNYGGTKAELDDIINTMSDSLWDLKAPGGSKQQLLFQDIRDNLHKSLSKDTHYLLVDGINIDGDIKLGPFDELQKVLLAITDKKKLAAFSNALKSCYNYIYIPVETNINDYLRLENSSIQHLIGEDIKSKIDDVFDKQVTTLEGSNKKIIQIINDNLNSFVSSVEKTIQKIDKDYSFKTDPNVKRSVTSKDLRGRVIEEYFKNRTLKNKDTKIYSLSSGQRKKALIDIIYSLITENSDIQNESNIILAIDEPEASLDVTNCFEQFEKIEKISLQNIQTFVTTHWYGALPIINDAIIYHTKEDEKKVPEISSFASGNLFDNHAAHRVEDIFFKSIYDLSSSILSSLRNGSKDWIIVEGHSDKIYLQSYFNSKNVKFLSIGGIDRMISLVDFLSVPLRNKSETEYTKNKIVFLSDNDMEYKSSSTENSKTLYFKRYVFKDGEVKLIDYTESKHGEEIRIEDVLSSDKMWQSLNNLSIEIPDLEEILKKFNVVEDFEISKFGGDYSFLETEKKGKEKVELFKQLSEILKPLKTRLALKYNELPESDAPKWISDVKKLLKTETKPVTRPIKRIKQQK
jgi:ABC-type cobalamin/Fe3+-siderophores transport system ATPase subunit